MAHRNDHEAALARAAALTRDLRRAKAEAQAAEARAAAAEARAAEAEARARSARGSTSVVASPAAAPTPSPATSPMPPAAPPPEPSAALPLELLEVPPRRPSRWDNPAFGLMVALLAPAAVAVIGYLLTH
ncbi:MAG: hypothetical protein KBG48_33665 [Kofleriaceae bacterium]|jgi:hypothetical protein|nr:hypothetical protein [Kofleriaceae bacterium]MBP9172360.1 hypothetical protein [Kofleriaceae bacterium]MBP9862736.1 hypothetical protein [Kofleriaceae bacterium]